MRQDVLPTCCDMKKHSALLLSLVLGLGLGLSLPLRALDFFEDEKVEAKNPAVLHLFPEPGELLGWISGTKDLSGESVSVTLADTKDLMLVPIEKGNLFRWVPKGKEAQRVIVWFEGERRVVSVPALTSEQPVAFFVVDRSVYRPQTKLQFAAFLREPDGEGGWRPLQREDVEVEIKSSSKKITVGKLKLAPDDFGRVTGEYTFAKADPLDDYTVSVKGLNGEASVKVAEFRKAKVRVEIEGERKDGKLRLEFQALNFLNKPVPARTLRFSGRIVKREQPADDLFGLDVTQFHAWDGKEDHWFSLSVEKQALLRSGSKVRPGLIGEKVVHTFNEEMLVGETGRAEHFLKLDPTWRDGYVVEIDAVMIDSNSREQKTSKSLPLGDESEESLEVDLAYDEIPAGERFEATATSSTGTPVSFLVFRLREITTQGVGNRAARENPFLIQGGRRAWNQRWYSHPRNQINHHQLYMPVYQWPQYTYEISREFISLTPGKPVPGRDGEHRAQLALGKEGAYIIQAITHDQDGLELRQEASMVILSDDRAKGLYLALDNDRLNPGDALQGSLQSRYRNAQVLLTVRDGRGLQVLEAVQLKEGRANFELNLPKDLSLACQLSAIYSDHGDLLDIDTRRFLVAPADKEVRITSKVPKTVDPGSEVTLEFDVHREEEMDLVVSVYDQSLLGIAPERPVDGRSLFFADLRVEQQAAHALMRRYLAGWTPNMLKEGLKEALALPGFAEALYGSHYRQVFSWLNARTLNEQVVRAALAWRGAPIEPHTQASYWFLGRLKPEEMDLPILELMNRQGVNYESRLQFGMMSDSLTMWTVRMVNGVEQAVSHDAFYGAYYNSPFYVLGGGTGFDQQLFSNGIGAGGRGRGDSHHSFLGAANSAMSFTSGQAMVSHLPVVAAPSPPLVAPGQVNAQTIRRDFSDSAFFNAKVRTDAKGTAKVRFKLPDSLTNWRVVVTAVSRNLHLGRHTASFKTFRPVMVWPMLPQCFTSGDRVRIFATVHNYSDREQEFVVSTTVKNGDLHDAAEKKVMVKPREPQQVYFDFEAGDAGFTEILMAAKCAAGEDASLKRLPVNPCTAEQVITRSGFVNGEAVFDVPEGINLEQARLEVTVVPSLAGDMLDSLGYLVSYPHGCVEQTMSRFLPVIKVAQILEQFEIDDPSLRSMVPKYGAAGVKRLLELQRPDGGWGWNGNSRTHEMMTPYALFGLVEAEKAGFTIPSETAIPRGMDRLAGFINGMGDRQSADRIFCMWVYRHHAKLADPWWKWLENITDRTLGTEKDRSKLLSDYGAALALEMAARTERRELAKKLARLLVLRANKTGGQASWRTANFSRWGNDRFEITAAVLKAFAAHDPQHEIVPEILQFFVSTKRGKKWNSTKDTAMILYAMCDYLSTQKREGQTHKAETHLTVNGKGHKVLNETWKPATLVIEGKDLKEGQNALAFTKGDKKHLYRMVFRFWKNGQDVAALNDGVEVGRIFTLMDAHGHRIRTLRSGDTVPRGSYIKSHLTAFYPQGRLNYTLAANPKLSCGEYTVQDEKLSAGAHVLREAKAAGVYWHHEQGNQRLTNESMYRAELAGEFLIAPAYVELMYDTAVRGHSGSFKLIVSEDAKPEKAIEHPVPEPAPVPPPAPAPDPQPAG